MLALLLLSLAATTTATLPSFALPIDDQPAAGWTPSTCPSGCTCALRFIHDFNSQLRTVECHPPRSGVISARHERLLWQSLPVDVEALLLKGVGLRAAFNNDNNNGAVSDKMLPELLYVDASDNRLSDVPAMLRDGSPQLRVLNLDDNRLVQVDDDAFKPFHALRQLKLRGNRLSAIAESAFSHLSALEFLDLSHNRLTYIHPGWWAPSQRFGAPGPSGSLYELRLAHNHLNIIQSGAFRHLAALLALDLADNRLFQLSSRAFEGMWRLEFLDLSGNSLADAFLFESLAATALSLKSLDVSRNTGITALRRDALAGYPNLKDVRLNGLLGLRFVDAAAFRDLPSLVMLEIHDCPSLSYVDPQAFSRTDALSHLQLHNNNLTGLAEHVRAALPALREVSFYGNPLACDCGSVWMRRALDSADTPTGSSPGSASISDSQSETSSPLRFREATHMTCVFPDAHRFKLFSSLAADDLASACEPRQMAFFEHQSTLKVGDPLSLECRGVGSPAPQVTWQLPSGALSPSERGSLSLPRVDPSDSGLYTCIVSNIYGARRRSTLVTVERLDVALAVASETSDSATLTWDGPDRARHAFNIYYRPLHAEGDEISRGFQYSQAAQVTPIMESLTLGGLRPGTLYEACLSLTDDAGAIVHLSCAAFNTLPNDASGESVRLWLKAAIYVAIAFLALTLAFYARYFATLPNCCRASTTTDASSTDSLYRVVSVIKNCCCSSRDAPSDPITNTSTTVVCVEEMPPAVYESPMTPTTPCTPLSPPAYDSIYQSKEMLIV